jgi:hypothetical protein
MRFPFLSCSCLKKQDPVPKKQLRDLTPEELMALLLLLAYIKFTAAGANIGTTSS